MERDFAIRFSDEVYASKEDVQHILGISSIETIWNKIISYRSYFKRNLDLFSIENKSFSVCLTLPLIEKVTSLERKLVKQMVLVEKMDEKNKENFINKSLFILGKNYAYQDSITIDDEDLNKLINDVTSEVPQAYLTLKNYLLSLKFYLKRSVSKYDLQVLTSFYGKILRKEINYSDFDSYLRMIDLNNPNDHLEEGHHYNAAPLDKIEPLLKDLLYFNSNSTLFPLLKGLITYFYLIYIKPFDYFNDECSLLSLKYIIAQDNIDCVPFLLNLEKRLLNSNNDELMKKFLLSEASLDLTYFIDYALNIIEDSINEEDDLLTQENVNSLRQEFNQIDEIKKTKPFIAYQNNIYSGNNPVVFEQKVSMPTLPTGLDEQDVDLIAENLLELYPSLKSNQAKFYASHCTIGKYYSISQYKKETGVAYETARTSMDNLVNLGFYKKEQVKNKYVYTPVVR